VIGMRQVALSALVVAAGSGGSLALTAGTAAPDTTIAYDTSTVVGATVTAISYTVNSDGSQITGATVKVLGDITTGKTVQVGFGAGTLSPCTIGHYNSGHDETQVVCTGMSQSTVEANAFHILVLSD
jgi:hypothetical protein